MSGLGVHEHPVQNEGVHHLAEKLRDVEDLVPAATAVQRSSVAYSDTMRH